MKALLVIDMQNVCVGENHADFFQYDRENLIAAVNKAIDANQGSLIIYIKNLMKKNTVNKFAPFQAYEGTPEVEFVPSLKMVSDFVFDKYTGDAFSNNKLNEFLQENKVDTVEVVGVDGGGCVALTARSVLKHGYKLIVNTGAIGTMFEKNRDKYFKKLKANGGVFI